MVDRLLRHLLVDLTGNTHRAEFCIDKLFSPDSERGRLGLARAAGLRDAAAPADGAGAVAARAGAGRPVLGRRRTPGELVRWGTDLYDRFLLPWYVRADIHDVVADLRRATTSTSTSAGSNRSSSSASRSSARSTLGRRPTRAAPAIEPWHVLGEEVAGSGTARYVDSSVERLQVLRRRVQRGSPHRHLQRCAGPAAADQHTGHRRRRRPLQGLGAVVGAAPDDRRARPARLRSRRPLELDDRSAAAPTRCRTRVDAPTTRSRSTPPRPRPAGAAGSSSTVTRPGSIDVAELDRLAAPPCQREYARTLDLRRQPRPLTSRDSCDHSPDRRSDRRLSPARRRPRRVDARRRRRPRPLVRAGLRLSRARHRRAARRHDEIQPAARAGRRHLQRRRRRRAAPAARGRSTRSRSSFRATSGPASNAA